MKHKLLLSLLFIASIFTAHAQTFTAAGSLGGATWDDVKSAAFGKDSTTVMTGMFTNTAQFGSFNLQSLGYQDAVVVKYDHAGNVLWANAIGGASEQDWGTNIALDNSGNVIVSGYFQSSVIKFTATDSIIKGTGFRNVFVAKYSSAGAFLWAKHITSGTTTAFITPRSITVDNNDNIIVSGQYTKSISCDAATLPQGTANVYLFKINASGTVLWGKHGTSTAQAWFADLCCDASNYIYATGKISKQIAFNGLLSNQVSGDQLIVAKFDAQGIAIWMQTLGDSLNGSTSENGFDCGNTIKLDNSGNIIIGGTLIDTTYLDTVLNQFIVKQSALVAKYSSAGIMQWNKTYGSNDKCTINDIDMDAAGNIFAIGTYYKTFSVGSTTLPFDTNSTAFVAGFTNATGAELFAYRNGNNTGDATGVAIGLQPNSGQINTLGNYRNSIAFNNTVTAQGLWDVYYNKLINPVTPSSINGIVLHAGIGIYPNPASAFMQISNTSSVQIKQVMIININGACVYNQPFAGNVIPVHQLAAGTYSVLLTAANGTSVHQLIKD
jgi:hypothetical protein